MIEETCRDEHYVQHEQIAENVRYAKLAAVATIFNAVIAVVAAWHPSLIVPLSIWAASMVALSLVRIRVGGRLSADSKEALDAQQRDIEWVGLATGVMWALGIVSVATIATPAEFTLAVIIGAGIMGASATTYTSLARAAQLFIAPVAIGCLVALWIPPWSPSISGSLILACYTAVLMIGASQREMKFCSRVRMARDLAATADTVKLLLNDFESQSADWLWEVDGQGRILKPNDRFGEAAGRGKELLAGTLFADLFDYGRERDIILDHLERPYRFRNLTLKLTVAGSPRWWTITGQPTAEGGMRGVASDVTVQKRAEEQVSHMAHYDGLTDLANRFLFNETLSRAIKRQRNAGEVAVLYLDLDSFKAVNDTLGHAAGDRLLTETARRIESCVWGDDLVARLGGDEFAILIKGDDAVDEAAVIANRILSAVNTPVDLDGQQVICSTSVGIAQTENRQCDASLLMKRADLALYAAKEAGRNRVAFYEEGMDEAAQARRQLEMDLRAALTVGEFELHYQPLVNIASGETSAFEALIRWNHPTRGVVMPDEFIPLAEETGLIVQLGEWVIREACREVALWPEHLHVSVNLSPAQMRSSALIGTVFNAVAAANIDPKRLHLEITENVLLHDSEVNLATLHKMRDFGVRIALDDFGTGYSSLNYLRSFPFDKIKIDKCFVSELNDNPGCQAIVRAVVELASDLGMETTAEGVETAEQLDRLRDKGCTEAQGYLFSRPDRPEQFTDLRPTRALSGQVGVPLVFPDRIVDAGAGSRVGARSRHRTSRKRA